jgi:thymidylate kinase
MMMLVEILGLPGSGKSTLSDRLSNELFDMPQYLTPINPSGYAVLFKIIRLIVSMVCHNPSALFRLIVRSDGRWLLSKLAYRWAGLDKRLSSGLLIDSGLLQPLLSYAAEYSKTPVHIDDVLAVLRVIPLPGAVIYLDCGVEVSFRRYQKRQKLTKRRAEVNVTIEGFKQAQEICDYIIGTLPRTKVLRVPGEVADVHDTLKQVSECLISWINDIERREL